MAQYIRFAQAVPAMPTLWSDGRREQLVDGVRLLQSLRQAGYARAVACIWRAQAREEPAGGVPFSAEVAERLGSQARLITFELGLETSHVDLLDRTWAVPGTRIGAAAYGWTAPDAASLPDWRTWVETLHGLHAQLPRLQAINGRQPPFG